MQNDCRHPSWSFYPQDSFSMGSNPWPPVCAHPLPLLSLVQDGGLESLPAWGVSLLLPSHFVHPLSSQSNEHLISLAPWQQLDTPGLCELLAQGGVRSHRLFHFLSFCVHTALSGSTSFHTSNDPQPTDHKIKQSHFLFQFKAGIPKMNFLSFVNALKESL